MSPHSCGFLHRRAKTIHGKCLEQATVKLPRASRCCSSASSRCHREGPRPVGAIACGLGTGNGVCCAALARQKSRSDSVAVLLPSTPQEPCPPSPLLAVGLSPCPGRAALSAGCSAAAAPVVLLWCGSVLTAIKILRCR